MIRRQSDEAMRAKLENSPFASEAVFIFLVYPTKQNVINEYVSVDKHLAGLRHLGVMMLSASQCLDA